MLKLKVINMWGGPGSGKSTITAGLFNLMKAMGLRVELVTEFAKDLTYEKNYGTLTNQFLLAAVQDQRLRRLVGQVDWAITDSPLPLGITYCTKEYDEWLPATIEAAYDRYDNYDFRVKRCKEYQRYGRSQTECEALAIDISIKALFDDFTENMELEQSWTVDGDQNAPLKIWTILCQGGYVSAGQV